MLSLMIYAGYEDDDIAKNIHNPGLWFMQFFSAMIAISW